MAQIADQQRGVVEAALWRAFDELENAPTVEHLLQQGARERRRCGCAGVAAEDMECALDRMIRAGELVLRNDGTLRRPRVRTDNDLSAPRPLTFYSIDYSGACQYDAHGA